ncbi:hypothetical protein PoB_003481900 [Plakobranchus ocellatus]|uniref:Uncharacterized protein n=1 Tax=Plakobranchus ocellatus TaxID=259542 RepID=A0AAV4AKQ7_9GAST|nr:hypothetical protein PoB_003481900 [Plakobranchus ocellatus]
MGNRQGEHQQLYEINRAGLSEEHDCQSLLQTRHLKKKYEILLPSSIMFCNTPKGLLNNLSIRSKNFKRNLYKASETEFLQVTHSARGIDLWEKSVHVSYNEGCIYSRHMKPRTFRSSRTGHVTCNGAQARDRRVPADLRVDSPSTMPPTPPETAEETTVYKGELR